jgi:hypothetical protein
MSCWTNNIAYTPNKQNAQVGGFSAKFSAPARSIGKSTAIEAAKRVLNANPMEETGDLAFDERAAAFRTALLQGTREAYKESSDGFTAAGLYISLVT